MSKRHFLMLAHTYVPGAPIGGYYASEKLDGQRAFWDGGISRGLACTQVPFSNTEKHDRLLVKPTATGLWTRYGQPIPAPDWFLDQLPTGLCLDGELYLGRNSFQKLISITKTFKEARDWRGVKYLVFDMPPPHIVFGDGEIKETNFKKKMVNVLGKLKKPEFPFKGVPQYRLVYEWMHKNLGNDILKIHYQEMLPEKTSQAAPKLMEMVSAVTGYGGEGIMLRNPTSIWIPERTYGLLKCKQIQDAEATVVGYVWGRETDLGSKLLGLMGALVVEYNGKIFELSGFTNQERHLVYLGGDNRGLSAHLVGHDQPGKPVEEGIGSEIFPRGSKVTFRFRELSDDGVPKEARFWRKYE